MLLLLSHKQTFSNNTDYFIVTAYYSPLPEQEYYITGNYEDEKKLNGQWIAGASWKKVFSGMLAAPKNYAFGTKIYLQWLWVGSVEDRGGAIVSAWNRGYAHDRIDVWMWYGDEGLKRALYWGKRKVKGNITSSLERSNINYEDIPAPIWATKWLKKNISTHWNIFNTSLGKWSNHEQISQLQNILIELWYLSAESYTVWVYDAATISAIFHFQVFAKVLQSETDPWAGSYGPKTRKALKKYYRIYELEKQKKEDFLKQYKQIKTSTYISTQKNIQKLKGTSYGNVSPQVRELQKNLKTLWFFSYKDTAIFWKNTKEALIQYQIHTNIIANKHQIGAWIFWPKTQKQMIDDLTQREVKAVLIQKDLLTDYEKYIES